MSFTRMRFRGQLVWVRVDAAGKLVLDGEGRAEMKYREEDARSYRPSGRNLEPAGEDAGKPAGEDAGPPGAPAAAPDLIAAVPAPIKPSRPRPAVDGETIHVWTDGACTGNPGPMGLGVVVLGGKDRRELGEYLGQGTNNIAELTAVLRGLDLAEELDPDRARPVRVYTDSAYSIGVISKGWKAKANQELVARLRRRVAEFGQVVFVKVAGHAGVPENERCDELARMAVETRGRR
jgi:ribonuclease HI